MAYDNLKIPNQGNIVSNLRLLYEMKYSGSEYMDSNGFFSKRDIAEIGANSLLITSGISVGNDVVGLLDNSSISETDNSPLQNAKMRMQLLRMLGLVSADYDSELYAITELGDKLIEQTFGQSPNHSLLRELFMSIASSSEAYDHNCDLNFECYIGYEICFALSKLDYRLSTMELTAIGTYSIQDISSFVEDVKRLRSRGQDFPKNHPHFPRTQRGTPLRQPANLTRSINQILRICGIINLKQERIGSFNYYTCTESGKEYVDRIANLMDRKKLNFLHPAYFRKENLIKQKQYCTDGLSSLYQRAGIDDGNNNTCLVFSPYQQLPETTVLWSLGKEIRQHPNKTNAQMMGINNAIQALNLRVEAKFRSSNGVAIHSLAPHEALVAEMLSAKDTVSKDEFTTALIHRYYDSDKNTFYPFVHSLLRILGLNCQGEVARYDGYSSFKQHVIPTEIKSRTELPTYGFKGLRQAIENKILSWNDSLSDDLEYASLVVGFDHPTSTKEIETFINLAKEKYNIKIIAMNIGGLIGMCVSIVWDSLEIDLDKFLKSYGIFRG